MMTSVESLAVMEAFVAHIAAFNVSDPIQWSLAKLYLEQLDGSALPDHLHEEVQGIAARLLDQQLRVIQRHEHKHFPEWIDFGGEGGDA